MNYNLSYITKDLKSYERHMLEHLVLYRTKNFTEAASLYNYLTEHEVELDFYSRYDFMEITFYNVSKEIEKVIDNEWDSWYFTKEDFELEKRIINIEDYNTDKTLHNEHRNAFIDNVNYTAPFDTAYFKSVSYEDVMSLKEGAVFTKVRFDNKSPLLSDYKPDEKFKIKEIINRGDLRICDFYHDPRLREVFILVSMLLSDAGVFVQRHNNFTENSITIKTQDIATIKNIRAEIPKAIQGLLEKFKTYCKSNSVDYELFDFYNIDTLSSAQKMHCIDNILLAITTDEVL